MQLLLVRDVMKGVLTVTPYPRGRIRSPGLVELTIARTTLTASCA